MIIVSHNQKAPFITFHHFPSDWLPFTVHVLHPTAAIPDFGKNVFKIGMTRRLEPYDRIYELGDASVPFPFDVHALIFSDNAPELEAKIQNNFHRERLNKINNRKEFYKADINEIEKIIKMNYNKVVDFEKQHSAEQYRESLLIKD